MTTTNDLDALARLAKLATAAVSDVQCGGVVVHPGDFILGDDDGVAVIPAAQLPTVLDAAEAIKRKELGYREAMAQGHQIADLIGLRDGPSAGVVRAQDSNGRASA